MSGSRAAQVTDEEEDGAETQEQIEARARAMGWHPLEEYRGRPGGWKTAAAYIAKAESDIPVLRENLRRMEAEVIATRRAQDEAASVINDMSQRLRSADERGYNRAKAELMAQRERAVSEADTNGFKAAERELEELEKTRAPAAPAAVPPPPPEVQEWVQRNPWYNSDADMAELAKVTHARLLRSNPGLTIAQNLERVAKTVRAAFPEKFPEASPARQQEREPQEPDENPRRRQAAADVAPSTGGSGPRRQDPRGFDAMPKDAKDAYAKYARAIGDKKQYKPLTKEEFAADYWSQFD